MAKDAYYFSHDSNAKDDPKCTLLIEQLGLEGYGIYWVLVETLRDQPEYKYPLMLIPSLARKYNTTAEKMKVVVASYKLFEIDDENFFSMSLNKRMEFYEKIRENRKKAGIASANKRALLLDSGENVQHMFNTCSTGVQQIKEIKVNEIKVKESKLKEGGVGGELSKPITNKFVPPTFTAVKEYCIERNNTVDAQRFIDFYESKGWLVGKNKMKDWKAAVRTWEQNSKGNKNAKKEMSGMEYLQSIINGGGNE